jgi:hypothetical protein
VLDMLYQQSNQGLSNMGSPVNTNSRSPANTNNYSRSPANTNSPDGREQSSEQPVQGDNNQYREGSWLAKKDAQGASGSSGDALKSAVEKAVSSKTLGHDWRSVRKRLKSFSPGGAGGVEIPEGERRKLSADTLASSPSVQQGGNVGGDAGALTIDIPSGHVERHKDAFESGAAYDNVQKGAAGISPVGSPISGNTKRWYQETTFKSAAGATHLEEGSTEEHIKSTPSDDDDDINVDEQNIPVGQSSDNPLALTILEKMVDSECMQASQKLSQKVTETAEQAAQNSPKASHGLSKRFSAAVRENIMRPLKKPILPHQAASSTPAVHSHTPFDKCVHSLQVAHAHASPKAKHPKIEEMVNAAKDRNARKQMELEVDSPERDGNEGNVNVSGILNKSGKTVRVLKPSSSPKSVSATHAMLKASLQRPGSPGSKSAAHGAKLVDRARRFLGRDDPNDLNWQIDEFGSSRYPGDEKGEGGSPAGSPGMIRGIGGNVTAGGAGLAGSGNLSDPSASTFSTSGSTSDNLMLTNTAERSLMGHGDRMASLLDELKEMMAREHELAEFASKGSDEALKRMHVAAADETRMESIREELQEVFQSIPLIIIRN